MKLIGMGILIGIGKILPGISGSVLAIRLGIYEKVIDSILNFFSNKKENSIFLSLLGTGFLLAIIICSKILLTLFLKFECFLKIVFFLFILVGIPELLKKSNSLKIASAAFLLSSCLFLLPKNNITISYFGMGVIESFSTIIPGISGTSIFLSLGWYEELLSLFSNLYLFPIQLVPFFLGVLIGGYFSLKMMNFLFKNYSKETYSAIIGFLLSSLFFIF